MDAEKVIKALVCCGDKICKHCPNYSEDIECSEKLIKEALDLIKRQQAEIEALINGQETLQKMYAEAYKYFAERLKEKFKNINSEPSNEQFDWILHDYVPRKIDEVLKELTEGSNGEV